MLKTLSAAVSKLSLQQLKLEGVGFDLVFPVFTRYINILYSMGLAIQGQHSKGNKREEEGYIVLRGCKPSPLLALDTWIACQCDCRPESTQVIEFSA